MRRKLREHQLKALEYASNKKGIAFFMEMRLGKTLCAIKFVKLKSVIRKILVIAPLTVLSAWEDELAMEQENYVLGISQTNKEPIDLYNKLSNKNRTWYLVNFQTASISEFLKLNDWDLVIVDESVIIKNPKAKITKQCQKYYSKAPFKMVLSGMPITKSQLDIFEQAKFVNGSFMGYRNYWQFRDRFFYKDRFDWLPKPGTEIAISNEIKKQFFVLSRKQAGLKNTKIYQKRKVQISNAQIKLQKQIIKDYAWTDKYKMTYETSYAPVARGWLRKIAGGFDPHNDLLSDEKYKELNYLIHNELKDQSIIVWFRYRHELFYCAEKLQEQGFSVETVHKDVKYQDRAKIFSNFNKGNTQFILATEKSIKYGVNLSKASTCIYYSNEESLDDRIQTEDRILSQLDNDSLLIIDLITESSYDGVDTDVLDRILAQKFDNTYFLHR